MSVLSEAGWGVGAALVLAAGGCAAAPGPERVRVAPEADAREEHRAPETEISKEESGCSGISEHSTVYARGQRCGCYRGGMTCTDLGDGACFSKGQWYATSASRVGKLPPDVCRDGQWKRGRMVSGCDKVMGYSVDLAGPVLSEKKQFEIHELASSLLDQCGAVSYELTGEYREGESEAAGRRRAEVVRYHLIGGGFPEERIVIGAPARVVGEPRVVGRARAEERREQKQKGPP